jgi:hypothetical protein
VRHVSSKGLLRKNHEITKYITSPNLIIFIHNTLYHVINFYICVIAHDGGRALGIAHVGKCDANGGSVLSCGEKSCILGFAGAGDNVWYDR